MKPLVVIPVFMSRHEHMTVLGDCLASIRKTVSDQVDILLVDDCSPYVEGYPELEAVYGRYDFDVHYSETNEGFSRTVNVGLAKARDEGREAILMNADIEMLTPGWLTNCQRTTSPFGGMASVVGALLLYPNGLIQHAGIYFSLLSRGFDHIYKYGPQNLPEALEKRVCPVTGAFQYIRPEALEEVGLYDEEFRMGYEDVDYCVRVFKNDMACVYNPNIRAVHFESMFRGERSKKLEEWHSQSLRHLMAKYAFQNFAGLAPTYW